MKMHSLEHQPASHQKELKRLSFKTCLFFQNAAFFFSSLVYAKPNAQEEIDMPHCSEVQPNYEKNKINLLCQIRIWSLSIFKV